MIKTTDRPLIGVGSVPEPSTWAMMLIGCWPRLCSVAPVRPPLLMAWRPTLSCETHHFSVILFFALERRMFS